MTKIKDFEDDIKDLASQYWGADVKVNRVYPSKYGKGCNVMIYNISFDDKD